MRAAPSNAGRRATIVQRSPSAPVSAVHATFRASSPATASACAPRRLARLGGVFDCPNDLDAEARAARERLERGGLELPQVIGRLARA